MADRLKIPGIAPDTKNKREALNFSNLHYDFFDPIEVRVERNTNGSSRAKVVYGNGNTGGGPIIENL